MNGARPKRCRRSKKIFRRRVGRVARRRQTTPFLAVCIDVEDIRLSASTCWPTHSTSRIWRACRSAMPAYGFPDDPTCDDGRSMRPSWCAKRNDGSVVVVLDQLFVGVGVEQ